jgi:hypothetical protein
VHVPRAISFPFFSYENQPAFGDLRGPATQGQRTYMTMPEASVNPFHSDWFEEEEDLADFEIAPLP